MMYPSKESIECAERAEEMRDAQRQHAERMQLRDTFAAAALTGLIANGDYSVESTPLLAYRMADAMLRERANVTPASHATPSEGASQGECTEPSAWLVEGCEYDTGCEYQYVAMLKEQADAAAADGATVTPLNISQQSRLWVAAAEYTGGISSAGESKPTLTQEELEAVEIAVEYVGSAYQVEHHAAVLRGLLERTR